MPEQTKKEQIKDVLVTNSVVFGKYFFAQIREGNQLIIWDRGMTPKQLEAVYESLEKLIRDKEKGR